MLFNAKRDLHWLRRYGIRFQHKRIWDVQNAHFIQTGQALPYPSLNDVCEYFGLEKKIDKVWEQYWSKGIDTPQVPWDLLIEYLEQDCVCTEGCYLLQLESLESKQFTLTKLVNIDTLILEEIEWNGIQYDVEESLKLAEGVREEISKIDESLLAIAGHSFINWNSPDHISAVLYGGSITIDIRVPDGVFKTGKRIGQAKFRVEKQSTLFPRLVEPLKGTELQKDGLFSTDEPTLRQIRASGKAKTIIGALLSRAKLDKIVSSYYEGIPKRISTGNWSERLIHGTLNQCVAATGRLSSSKPNLQNTDKKVEKLFRSRYV